ncbi:DUF4221 family protein [Algoriphagus yeomjeoni]|uniref:Uncharacterized protein DUF4221 n=1 Tax=Algoriphagus yeomjeoni TaxID=291403 RepID=A0A327PKL4_9BACT|nr:DUF4221 family protein [Algoriphagus yeomjeoni]RAI92143.1 uncharacterized protein DUF4221 [Algoriphagus yeomjeoni]
MKIPKELIIAIILLASISCTNESKVQEEVDDSAFVKIDSLVLKLDSLSSYDYRFFDIGNFDFGEGLIILNDRYFSLDVYNLAEGKLAKRIDLPREGPIALSKNQGISFHSVDSIFVFSYMMLSNSGIVSESGEMVKVFKPKIIEESIFDQILNHASTNSMPTLKLGNSLLFNNLSMRSPRSPSAYFEEVYPNFEIDLDSDSLRFTKQINYPSEYFSHTWPESFVFHSKAVNDEGEVVVSWPAIDSLFVYDADLNLKKSVLSKSAYKNNTFNSTVALSQEDVSRAVLTNSHYPLLFFDSWRNVYYRFVNIGGDYNPEMLVGSNSVLKNEFSVMIYDRDFNKIGEQKFPAEVYNQYMAFVSKKGLYLPRTNFYYEGINEDQVKFDVFLFEK